MRTLAPVSRVLIGLLLSSPLLAAEPTRTLKVELSPDAAARFRVENLAGSMKIVPGTGATVTAVATIHAENDSLAQLMRFEQVPGGEEGPTLRLIYPLDRHETIRYDAKHREGHSSGILGGESTTTQYDGHRVKVSSREGVLLYADVEVRVPPAPARTAAFRNEVGTLQAEGVEGNLRFYSSSGDVSLQRLKGEVRVDTGSGDVKADSLSGTFACDTGSGDCTLSGLEGDRASFKVGSGDVLVKSAKIQELVASTGSGDVKVSDSDVERFKAGTGSGDVILESRGTRLATVKADTGSGDVTLRMPADATFEARGRHGSGDILSRFKDAEPILEHKRVVGYRRGDGRIRIDVSTGSGDLLLEPLP